MEQPNDQRPQRVLITAAAAGIGRVIAATFRDAGATVEICDVDPVALDHCRTELPGVGVSLVDLADADQIDAWLDGAIERLGGVDVLINNSGIKGPTAPVEDVALDEWRSCLAVGLDAHFLCTRKVVPVMKVQGSGSIVNISSTAGMFGFGMRTPYTAAKWAVIGLTKSLAVELGPHGIRCNCVCPGSVRGERIDRVIAADAARRGVSPDDVAAEYVEGQSIRRFVEPLEVASLCLYLSSPAAAMITGQAIAVDGHSETFHI